MIVLHFAEYASGGVATYLKNLIKSQLNSNEVKKVFLLVSGYRTDEELLDFKSPKLVIIKYSYKRSLLGIINILKQSRRIKEISPDIIHIHSTIAGLVRIRFIFSSLRKKIIYCSHGWAFNRDGSFIKNNLIKLVELILSYGCARIVNISNYEMRTSKFINNKKLVMIYNSIPEFEIDDVTNQSNKIKFLFVGRLDKQKGIDLLVEAMSKFDYRNNWNLTIVGDSIVDPVVSRINNPKINFLGWKSTFDVRELIEKSDIVVVPSRWEGFGLVTLEAMNCKKMLLVSDAGALPEIVENGINGIIFNRDSLSSLVDTLNNVLGMSRDEIVRMGINGKKIQCKIFDYDVMLKKVNGLYRELL